jgi:hypothetical protein
MNSILLKSFLKVSLVVALMVWVGRAYANDSCRDINGYDICMNVGPNGCVNIMTLCTSYCPQPPPPPPNCDTTCEENFNQCQADCNTTYCDF